MYTKKYKDFFDTLLLIIFIYTHKKIIKYSYYRL